MIQVIWFESNTGLIKDYRLVQKMERAQAIINEGLFPGYDSIILDTNIYIRPNTHYIGTNLQHAEFTEEEKRLIYKPIKGFKLNPRTKQMIDNRTLAEAKQYKLEDIAATRALKAEENFTYDGKTYKTEKEDISIRAGAVKGKAKDTKWMTATGEIVILNSNKMEGLQEALSEHIQNTYNIAFDLKVQVDAATTKSQVDAIQWPS